MRTQILQAAQSLFLRQGYHGLSMRMIAEEVGITKAAIYYHFDDKQELFLAILEASLAEVSDLLDGILAEDSSGINRLEKFIHRILSRPLEDRAGIYLASREITQLGKPLQDRFNLQYHQKFLSKIVRMFREGISAGEFRTADPWFYTWTLLGMLYPYIYPSPANRVAPPDEVADQLVLLFLEGTQK